MTSRAGLLVKLYNKPYFIRDIDLNNKRIFLGLKRSENENIPSFNILLASYLIALKKGEFRYYIERKDFTHYICDKGCGNFKVLEEESTWDYIVGYLRLDCYKLQCIWQNVLNRESDFIVYKKENSIILSNRKVKNIEDLGLLNSFQVSDKNWLGNELQYYGHSKFNIAAIRKHRGNKSTMYDLVLSLWLTRDGNNLYLGNEKDDLSGALGLNLFPYYYYPELKDGESRFVDIICTRS